MLFVSWVETDELVLKLRRFWPDYDKIHGNQEITDLEVRQPFHLAQRKCPSLILVEGWIGIG